MTFQEIEIKYCKYCNEKLKKIDYEIVELDKTGHFKRYYCEKCFKVFHFREPTQRRIKESTEKKEKKTRKSDKEKDKKRGKSKIAKIY